MSETSFDTPSDWPKWMLKSSPPPLGFCAPSPLDNGYHSGLFVSTGMARYTKEGRHVLRGPGGGSRNLSPQAVACQRK